ncbi:MAG: orotidine-5'-phosphate decarboxylase [Treponema sp.]|nr:orotidine-5'-phosphate decarboxylase [Treponema sp.]
MKYCIDKLYEAVGVKGHVCLGLDTSVEYVPGRERSKALNDAQAVLGFNKALIDATYDVVACFKVQIAYYEEMGIEGLKVYSETLKYIKSKSALVIADIKRGDIADTALRYVKAHYSGDFSADFVTISPYMGMDSIEPWLNEARNLGKGAFVLMRTSNSGMKDFQYLTLSDDFSGMGKKQRVYHIVGNKMTELAKNNMGSYGYGIFGVVVGCTEREEASELRQFYPDLFFLIPGYGAQGGGAQDVAILLKDGNGGVVNASRSIITAWQKEANAENADNVFAANAARSAAIKMRDEIKNAL